MGFDGVGISQKGSKFVHVDMKTRKTWGLYLVRWDSNAAKIWSSNLLDD